MRKSIALIVTLLICISAFAQRDSSGFRVKSFRKLDWDVDARVNYPMMDQNNKKAALIKVVTTIPGFDFDVGIMGVVEVKKEIGELWVYVPENVRGITIRHPEFGVIRNYKFEIPIESASVYELTLETPKKEQDKVVIVKDSIVYVTLPPEGKKKVVKKNRKPYDINILPYFEAPITEGVMSFGLIAAYNWEKLGVMTKMGYFGNGAYSKVNATIGCTLKCGKRVRLCTGFGYGGETDRTSYGSDVDQFLASGIEVNTGAILNFGMFSIYAGMSTAQFKHYYGALGIGVHLWRSGDRKK